MSRKNNAAVLASVSDVEFTVPTSRSGSPASLKSTIDQIEAMLLKGDRGGACKLATKAEMWSHALVLSHEFDQNLYRDAVLWFSRSLVSGSNMAPVSTPDTDKSCLRVLYNLIGGSGPAASM